MIGRMANRVRRVDEATIAGRRLQADLGAELREARLARGLRQIDVARGTDVSNARLSPGRQRPPPHPPLPPFAPLPPSRNGHTTVAIEAIPRLRDAQAQLRAMARKQRDGQATRLVILLAAGHANRAALNSAADVLATAFPLGTRATRAALASGDDPGANGIVLL